MKILLVQPPLVQNIISCVTNYLPEPLALQLLAANLTDHDVFLVDLRFSNNLIEYIQNIEPDLVGITCASMPEVPLIKEASHIIKKVNPNIHVVIGGQYPTFVPEEFINNSSIDFIVFGEGEITFSELVDTLETNGKNVNSVEGIGIIDGEHLYQTKPRRLIDDIDLLPFPDRDLITDYKNAYYNREGQYVTSMLTTRGCPSRCSFCSLWRFYHGTYRERSPENIYAEIESLDEELIHFIDDNFLHNVDRSWRILELLSGLEKKKKYIFQLRADIPLKYPELISAWVDIGLNIVNIGLESFKTEDLKMMRKNTSREINDKTLAVLKKFSINVVPFFIVSPYYDEEDFNRLVEYIESWGIKYPIFSVLTPLPGTVLYEQMKDEIILKDFKFYDLGHPVVKTRLPYQKFMNNFFNLFKRFYCNETLSTSYSYGLIQ